MILQISPGELSFSLFYIKKWPKKTKKVHFFSFLAITFEIIKILTSSFHWWATFFMLNPGIPKIAIFDVNDMVSINVNSGHKWPFCIFGHLWTP